jgi:hypothetical protein
MSRGWSDDSFERSNAERLSDYPNGSWPAARPIRIAGWVFIVAAGVLFWTAILWVLIQ